AKRGDIGSTARMYARALFDHLGADAVTVNPLMGRDSAEPFLDYTDRLTYFLVLTSNPGASDFLLVDGLYRRIAAALTFWAEHGNAGFVIGATRGDEIREVRHLGRDVPFLVPGVGAQGGDLERVIELGARADSVGDESVDPGLLFHVTRGVLPDPESGEDVGEAIRARAIAWRDRLREVMRYGDPA
ncbi:MAG: orotidine 5'-phosphate decarboxylase, partial [Phycisphaerales bacterium]|nr:orotidine 5'-phosphate decarboxylase [Phycisphaerales bacterium]